MQSEGRPAVSAIFWATGAVGGGGGTQRCQIQNLKKSKIWKKRINFIIIQKKF